VVLHESLDLTLVDVASGSDTRLMVKQVLEWSEKAGDGKPFNDSLF